ncbi:MAG: VOC family protein [Cyanobacteria bacterium]|nr:VOC family protein [Cyanobacteriota bacterium]
MAIGGIHHVAIICSDYGRAKQFYTQVLGFTVVAETYRAERQSYKLDLQLSDGAGGGDRIELFSFPDPPARPSYPEACGLRHLAFAVDDVEQFAAGLVSQGIAVQPIRIDELTGKRFTFFQDPDGLPLEVYEAEDRAE